MVQKILILGKRSLKNTVCSHFPVSILRFFNHICYIKHLKNYSTKFDRAELLPLSILYVVLWAGGLQYGINLCYVMLGNTLEI